MKVTEKIAALALGAIMIVGTVPSVHAQTVTPSRTILEQRCSIVTTRIDTMIARYDNNKQRHIEQHRKAIERVSSVVNQLESRGYDVTQLRADLKIWESDIIAFANQYTEFVSALRLSQDYACGKSQGDFKAQLTVARKELADVREASVTVRNFYQTTVRADLQALKNQKN